MSIKIMTEVWDHAPVSGGTLLVLLAIADSADETSRTCFPGIENLAHKARLSERQVKRAIVELAEALIVHVDRNASPFKTNLYRVSEPRFWGRSDKMSPTPIGHPRHPKGDTHVTSDVTPMSPKPSVTSEEPSVRAREDFTLFGETPEPPRKPKVTEQFERFWKVYPKKVGKPKAERNFARAVRFGADAEAIIEGARRYAASDQVARGFVKHPEGWLTDQRWLDPDLAPAQASIPAREFRHGEVVR